MWKHIGLGPILAPRVDAARETAGLRRTRMQYAIVEAADLMANSSGALSLLQKIGSAVAGAAVGLLLGGWLRIVVAVAVVVFVLWLVPTVAALWIAVGPGPTKQTKEAVAALDRVSETLQGEYDQIAEQRAEAAATVQKYSSFEEDVHRLTHERDHARTHALQRGLELERRHADAVLPNAVNRALPENNPDFIPGMPNLAVSNARDWSQAWAGRVMDLFRDNGKEDMVEPFYFKTGGHPTEGSADEPAQIARAYEQRRAFIEQFLNGKSFP